jgi:hypothetical protein
MGRASDSMQAGWEIKDYFTEVTLQDETNKLESNISGSRNSGKILISAKWLRMLYVRNVVCKKW